MSEKSKIRKVIKSLGYNRKDKIEFELVNGMKKGILYFNTEQLKEKGIELKEGDEIKLEEDVTGYKIKYQNEVIGRANNIKMYGTTVQKIKDSITKLEESREEDTELFTILKTITDLLEDMGEYILEIHEDLEKWIKASSILIDKR